MSVLWVGGCVLFISESEHNQRVRDLSADTADSGLPTDTGAPPEPTPYAGFYDGPLSVSLSRTNGQCEGEVELTVEFTGDISGSGSCLYGLFGANTLEMEFTGQVKGDQAIGELTIADYTASWQGEFYTSGPTIKLEGTFEGSLQKGGEALSYKGSFEVD